MVPSFYPSLPLSKRKYKFHRHFVPSFYSSRPSSKHKHKFNRHFCSFPFIQACLQANTNTNLTGIFVPSFSSQACLKANNNHSKHKCRHKANQSNYKKQQTASWRHTPDKRSLQRPPFSLPPTILQPADPQPASTTCCSSTSPATTSPAISSPICYMLYPQHLQPADPQPASTTCCSPTLLTTRPTTSIRTRSRT